MLLFIILLILLSHVICGKYAVWSVNTNEKVIALTFDDGPHQILTPRLLDILKEKNAYATFFVMGVKVKIHPEIVLRAHQEGHEVANHAFDHPVLAKLNSTMISYQIRRTNDLIYNATSFTPVIMRPPYGNTNPKVNEYMLRSEKLMTIIWSLDTLDWRRPKSEQIVEKVLQRAKPGDIILCHDIHPGTIQAIGPMIDAMQKKGYQFVTVSKLFAMQEKAAGKTI
jgi:peptidoglycan-N-acetylglucosamine deacetylase